MNIVFNAKGIREELEKLAEDKIIDYYARQLPSGEWRFRINPIDGEFGLFPKMVNMTTNQAGLFLMGFTAGITKGSKS